MSEKRINWWKWILVAGLVGLGANGLTQVWLQKDMGAKTATLATQVKQAQSLSSDMKNSLNGLSGVQESSTKMASTLQELDKTTGDMDSGLATLEHTVQGIASSIQSIGSSTAASGSALSDALNSAQMLLSTLDSVRDANTSAINHLNHMATYQAAINQDLHAMNQKTAVLP